MLPLGCATKRVYVHALAFRNGIRQMYLTCRTDQSIYWEENMKTLEIFGALHIDRQTVRKCTANVPAPGRDDSVHGVLFIFVTR